MHSIHAQELDIRNIKRGKKETLYLDVATTPTGMPIRQTIIIISGYENGPTLLVSGGVHGDEFEGPLTIMQLHKTFKPEEIRGTFIGLVVANPPAFEAATRNNPIDGLNLARVFPGNPNGSPSNQIAYWIGKILIGKCDFYLDLHSSGSDFEMPQMCGYVEGTGETAELQEKVARAFHAEAIWKVSHIEPGRTISYAAEHKIPCAYTECPATRCVSLTDVDIYKRGVRNTMRVLGMLDGTLEGNPSRYYLYGEQNNDDTIVTTKSGFFVPERRLLEWVKRDDRLGVVYDLSGRILEEIRAPIDGYIGLRRILPTVYSGDSVFILANRLEEELR